MGPHVGRVLGRFRDPHGTSGGHVRVSFVGRLYDRPARDPYPRLFPHPVIKPGGSEQDSVLVWPRSSAVFPDKVPKSGLT